MPRDSFCPCTIFGYGASNEVRAEIQQLDVFGKGSACCVLMTDAETESVSEPGS